MKKLAILGLMVLGGAASADQLYSNGPAVNASGKSILLYTGAGGSLGAGDQALANNVVADDFSVTGGSWNVTDLDFFNYQTDAVGFTFTDVKWSIISGDLSGGNVVASGTTAVTNGGLVGYRVPLNRPNNTERAIYDIKADIDDVTLGSGTYWLTWSIDGTGSSGPWQPPVADHRLGNAMQSVNGGSYIALTNTISSTAGRPVDLPFVVNGTIAAVPEPATVLSLTAGLALLGTLRRRRRD